MGSQFDYFVILAGMRTGSNFLESSLNAYGGINCLGEVFNTHFVGYPKQRTLFGIDMKQRETDPLLLIEKIKARTDGISGFRFFFDHDPRVLTACLADRRCAKIILRRNHLDTYVSREIARETGQWRLGQMQDAKSVSVQFDKSAYLTHVAENQSYLDRVNLTLQSSGQTAFQIEYRDLVNPNILNGLARYLGFDEVRKKTSAKTKKQNPMPLKSKVSNFSQMQKTLTDLLDNSLDDDRSFEPERGAGVPTYLAAQSSPLLFMPIRSGPTEKVRQWMSDLDGAPPDNDQPFTQKTLRQWKRRAKNHRSFTVIRHPVARLHDAFVRHILLPGDQAFPAIRDTLVNSFQVPLPDYSGVAQMDQSAHRSAFLGFINFVRGNLNGQTGIRVDSAWASQSELLRGMADFAVPDHILREDELDAGLAFLAAQFGKSSPPLVELADDVSVPLGEIFNEQIEKAARECYQRDYMIFGFGAWKSL